MDQKEFKDRLEIIEKNAKSRLLETHVDIVRDNAYYKKFTKLPIEPIFIASSEDIGTRRVRANHTDALLDYFDEQEKLKLANAPMK